MFLKKFKLDFIIIGAQKAGTSALDAYLRMHDRITMSTIKETHFFDDDRYFNGKPKYQILEEFYPKRQKNTLYGEATPIYLYWEPCIERMYRYNKKLKLVALLRNPINRAFSHWNMEFSRGFEDRSFEESIKNEACEIKHFKKKQHPVKSYLQRGLYSEQIERVYGFFPKHQVLFLKYEDFHLSNKNSLKKVLEFLDLEMFETISDNMEINKIPYGERKVTMEKSFMLDFFMEDIEKTEKLLNWNCNDWKV
ncbi:sulfotransferase domain-containing protein [Mangrovimonas sp. CR14]|uniref:sulfotransferase domain-containing protein n=1 Tax=Mangrovimonas sp. CR14 TaxID=2706120 RepID=UPI001420204C|nr:sulfotransferase [Mangrovimonas sp. CR14]NIK92517.1 sulfotransferase domain-containing protein [Mangrovimonas sp. CR14]